ncbi:LOW QUALITY PROTEIN: uncharacterized protein [Amphiura filiformis]|uniref:LOW QUALITY PROTEIN: uncharacterized protein n=1 Tax=Amphiura filiformis TaxID=82378 RepID=UPI003B2279FD
MAGFHPIRKPLQETIMPQQSNTCRHKTNPSKMMTTNEMKLMARRGNRRGQCHVDEHNKFSNQSAISSANEQCENKHFLDSDIGNKDENGNFVKNISTQSFMVAFEGDRNGEKVKGKKGSGSSLQDAFLKFRIARQNVIKQSQMMKERELATMCDSNQMWQLRMKFVEVAKSYFGVPYAKKYHQPGTSEYNAPLFLDCCALVRQVLRDLKEDFGFDIGSWNQAYQYDTLPITIDDEKDMTPGDLVFISGIYHSKKSKKQKHNMVHVEIWAGEGAKTIGARWQKGKVQVFDSYRFEAKSYHSMQYHFKSIDTWLQGICKSYCPEHRWSTTVFEPGHKSIFSVQDPEVDDEGAGDTEDDMIESDEENDFMTSNGNLLLNAGDEYNVENSRGKASDEETRMHNLKNSLHEERDEEQRCWEHIETSPVRASPEGIHNVSEGEQRCWEDIESVIKAGNSRKVPHAVCARNEENILSGHGTESERSQSHSLLSASQNHQHRKFAEQLVHNVFSSLGIKLPCNKGIEQNMGTHHDLDDKEYQSIVVTDHCQWSKGDGTGVSSEGVNDLGRGIQSDKVKREFCRIEDEMIQWSDLGSDELIADRNEMASLDVIKVENNVDQDGQECSNVDKQVCHRIGMNENESTGASCLCRFDEPDCNANTDEFDNTSLDDWSCCDFAVTSSTRNVNRNQADKILDSAQSCDKEFQSNDSSHNCGFDTTQRNHDDCSPTRKEADNLCSLDHVKDCPIVNELTSGCHNSDLFNLEPRDGDEDQTHNSASKGPTPGKAGRSTPGKKSVQKSQKGKDEDENPEPTRGGGGAGGSVSRSSSNKDLGPAFYIGGGNGVSLVEDPLVARGWHRISDRHSDSFKLKWVELKTHINYNHFRPGEQLVNRIPNTHLLATKTGLYTTLKDYERLSGRTKNKSKTLKMSDFFAESYVLDMKADREAFFQTFKEGEIWICKPNGMNQGKGIYLVRDLTELRRKYEAKETARKTRPSVHGSRLIQRYIPNPLLLNNKKFDVRTYMLIACTNPFIVLFHTGYLRLACDDYDHDSTDLHRHLTNQYVQKKHPSYQDMKDETVWSMERFNDVVNEMAEEKGLPKDWVMGYFHKQMNKIMVHCFNAVKSKLDAKLGFFDLLGFDFLIDTDFKIWLIEINVNPALHTNCKELKSLLPGMIEETLDIVLEINEKSRRNRPIMPLASKRNFVLLHNGSSSAGGGRIRPTKSTSPPQPSATRPIGARSSSPPKRASTGSMKPLSLKQNVTKVSLKTSKESAAGARQVNSKDAS